MPKRLKTRLAPHHKRITLRAETVETHKKIYDELKESGPLDLTEIVSRVGGRRDNLKNIITSMTYQYGNLAEEDDGKLFIAEGA